MKEQYILIGDQPYPAPYGSIGAPFEGLGRIRGLFVERAVRRFSLQLAMLLEADVSLLAAISLIRLQHRSRRWQRILAKVGQQLKEGAPLSQALAFNARIFRPGYVQTIVWAEGRGDPSDLILALNLLADVTTYRRLQQPVDTDEKNLDVFARRLRG